MSADLKDLIDVSRKYGSDPDWVLVGGGNTSMKENGLMYVKASGFELGTIGAEGFVKMSLEALNAIWDKTYPEDEKLREAAVLEDMMNARTEGDSARPSVEALLHSLVKGRLVVHTHPALINGITCGRFGEAAVAEMFGDTALWIPLTYPGYILANEIKIRLDAAAAAGKPYPDMIFMQNHGLFVFGETPDDIDKIHRKISDTLISRLNRKPVPDSETSEIDRESMDAFSAAAEKAWGRAMKVKAAVNADVICYADSDSAFEGLRLPFNPDQIVYSGPGPMRLDGLSVLKDAVEQYKRDWGREPQAVLVKDIGLFCVGDTDKKADSALALTLDSIKIAVYSDSFGGPLPMTDEMIIFIRDWEVEQYRSSISK